MKITLKRLTMLLVMPLSILAAGCGGSGGGGATVPTTAISGSVYAAPVSNASVTVRSAAGALLAGPVKTATDGSFSINVPTSALANPLRFEATGGTYTDEATATAGVTSGKLSAYVNGGVLTAGSSVALDPPNTIIHDLIVAGNTKTEADTAFNAAFGYIPDPTIVPRLEAPTASNQPQRLAAVRAGAFSYLTQTLGLAPARQTDLVAAIAKDLDGDGVPDGKDKNLAAIAITPSANLPVSGLQYNYAAAVNSCGDAQAAAVVTSTRVQTASYQIEYVPGMMAAAQGKTSFKIRLTTANGGAIVTGKNITLTPVMHMPGMTHQSPVDPVVTDNGDGTYSCTVYYLMMSSAAMGFWELRAVVDNETAVFYPSVGMAMGTALTKLYGGSSDQIANMMGMPTARTYYLFKDGAPSGTTFNLFIATLDNAMMTSFPAVSSGATLHDAANSPWQINPATTVVSVSTDNTTFYPATDNGNGHWSASNAGLTLGSGATVYVKLTVNSTVMTDIAGTIDYASFTLP